MVNRRLREPGLLYCLVSVASVVLTTIIVPLTLLSSSGHSPSHEAALPTGSVTTLELAGPLAVAPDGLLFVVDEARHEVLVRLPDGTFRVVAGDGKSGFSGDGGKAS